MKKIRRKPEFDRFHSGLYLESDSIFKKICDPSDDYCAQDLTNHIRSKLTRTWTYLIEKVNDSEKEISELKEIIKDLAHISSYYINNNDGCECDQSVGFTCGNCCSQRDYSKHKDKIKGICG